MQVVVVVFRKMLCSLHFMSGTFMYNCKLFFIYFLALCFTYFIYKYMKNKQTNKAKTKHQLKHLESFLVVHELKEINMF